MQNAGQLNYVDDYTSQRYTTLERQKITLAHNIAKHSILSKAGVHELA